MKLFKRKNSLVWHVTWYDPDGSRHRQSTGTQVRRDAEALARKWANEDFLQEHFGKTPEILFADVLLNYAKAQKRDHPKHFDTRTWHRLRYLDEKFKGYNVSDFTYQAVQKFVDERLNTVSSGTVMKDLAYLKAIINMARREGLTPFVPNFPRVKPSDPRTRWLTEDEESRLLPAAAPHLRLLIAFAIDTGGRLSELLGLDWRNVELNSGWVTFVHTKNGRDRSIKLCDRAIQTLEQLEPKSSGVVFTYAGKPIKSVKTAFATACKRAGVVDFRFHDLRHTFASRLVQDGVPIYNVMHLLGHRSMTMVQRYAHLAPEFQDQVVRVMNGRNLGTLATSVANDSSANPLKNLVPQEGLEPPTHALRMRCSTI
jgi:integrase